MRYELTDYEWAAIRPFLPNKPRGVPLRSLPLYRGPKLGLDPQACQIIFLIWGEDVIVRRGYPGLFAISFNRLRCSSGKPVLPAKTKSNVLSKVPPPVLKILYQGCAF